MKTYSNYDYSRFRKIFGNYESNLTVDDIAEDGVYKFGNNERQLDICINNLGKIHFSNGSRHVIVVFTGLMARANTKGPYFSGIKISSGTGITTISISDPALKLDATLPIGWYVGYKDRVGLPYEISDLLNKFSEKFECKLFLIGGSGGGFAALNVARTLARPARALVINPQTSISRYARQHVQTFLSFASGSKVIVNTPAEAASVLEDIGLHHDITQDSWSKHDILYIQNKSDWHVAEHLNPLMQSSKWIEGEIANQSICQERGLNVLLASWGSGHAKFPPNGIVEMLMRIGPSSTSNDMARVFGNILVD